MLVPGFNYLGINGKAPMKNPVRNRVDQVAFEHDRAYLQAFSTRDVLVADLVAVSKFVWQGIWAFVSAFCLTVKVLCECSVGVLYPARLFDRMQSFSQLLLLMCGLWLLILELRLNGLVGEASCAQTSTFATWKCLLHNGFARILALVR